tara:strand:+ start:1018 stop:1254 length:237 start_codon:yes stop_codon:yes gene_type:complete
MDLDLDQQFDLNHLLLQERKCRTCGQLKDLTSDFYLIRKSRGALPSSYSYECKICTVRRIVKNRRKTKVLPEEIYPDW